MTPLLIRNARIINGVRTNNQPIDNNLAEVLIIKNKITEIGFAIKSEKNYEVLDAQGQFLTPGWIDIQLNGAFGYDFTVNPETIWDAARKLPKLGTTSFLPTIITSPLESAEHAIAIQRAGPPTGHKGSNALGLHLEGPFLNPGKKGAHNPRHLLTPTPSLVENWSRANGVFLVTLAPELDDNFATTHELVKHNIIVSAGHSLATYEQAKEAFKAGIQCGTHLFNAQPAIEHRQPGLSMALLDTQVIFTGVIIDGVHMHPAMVNFAWKCKGADHFITVTDAISALGMPPGKYNLGDYEISVTDSSVTLKDGTLAGSIITQQQSLRNLIAWTGCTLDEAIQTITSTPARLLRLPNKGKIESGADADLVLINENLEIKATIVGGEILYQA